jgi:hypothetical protein
MGDPVSRREFFREAGRAGLRRLAEAVDGLRSAGSSEEPDLPAMAHDFSPELLAMEAERLGLDPLKDRERVIRAVYAALGGMEDEMSPG